MKEVILAKKIDVAEAISIADEVEFDDDSYILARAAVANILHYLSKWTIYCCKNSFNFLITNFSKVLFQLNTGKLNMFLQMLQKKPVLL